MVKINRFLLSCVFVILFSFAAYAGEVSLIWDPPEAAIPSGYKIYYGLGSGNYAKNVDVGNVLTATIPASEFVPGNTYYFAATAYYPDGEESGFSNEVSKAITLDQDRPLPPDNLRWKPIK